MTQLKQEINQTAISQGKLTSFLVDLNKNRPSKAKHIKDEKQF